MKVGMIDLDLYMFPQRKILNSDLMKLGAYYENNGHQVEVLNEKNDKFDYDMLCIFSNNFAPAHAFYLHPNIHFYGNYFNNREYMPFNNEIDFLETNYRIYDNFLKYNFKKGIYTQKDIEFFKNTKWVRLFPQGKAIDVYNIIQAENIRISDNDFFKIPNWREVIIKIGIYPNKVQFVNPIKISSTEDLNNFIYLRNLGFSYLRGTILIDNEKDFEQFLIDNKKKLKELQANLKYTLGYNKTNLYTETYYLDSIIPIIKQLMLLNNLGIKVEDIDVVCYSKKPLTLLIYNNLRYWGMTHVNNKYTFEEILLIKNRKTQADAIKYYYNFLKKKPEYRSWFNIKLFLKEV